VIREEWVALTGDYKKAIVLGQLIYWSERVRDRALYQAEERERYLHPEKEHTLNHGWFYKRAEVLSEETMMGVKPKAMREYVKFLVKQGWLDEKRPVDTLDRTLYYRANLVKIHRDILQLGYTLKHCTTHAILPTDLEEAPTCEKETATSEKETPTVAKQPSNSHTKTLATSEKENTSPPKSLDTKGFQATDSALEIKKERLEKEIIHTDYEERVCVRVMDLFGKKLSKTSVRALIECAEKEEVDLEEAIESTYRYHIQVEECRSIPGSIRYAIENGGWNSPALVKSFRKPVPKAISSSQTPQEKAEDDAKFAHVAKVKQQIHEKMELLGYVYNDELGQWEDPEDDENYID
jgi:hypothetical protein